MKVLIVDDNQNVRKLLRDHLPKSVDGVIECGDGEDAFELYGSHLPEWVLMDWNMPKMNGISAIRRIIGQFPDAKICMVTAYDDADLKKQALQAGACDFVLKDNLFELKAILIGDLEN
ncbi:MAG: response regulator transcription factor [Pyrinomonadaceae bacterium]|nr:response regulator transcription factor [Pyrinomonadaceae bacterium]